ncbi:MAG: hypothetical protein MUF49_06555 [Oculatellaceae cyanobacterium Prado106]|jgi:hypothetical protein|nr:hypothetical protein [Oculatellaceae cyanobacterium Prado106]
MHHPAFNRFTKAYLADILSPFGTVSPDQLVPRNSRFYTIPSNTGYQTEILQEILPSHVLVSPEVHGEAELVDMLFEPQSPPMLSESPFLNRLVRNPCILEIHRNPLGDDDVLEGVKKIFLWLRELQKAAEAQKNATESELETPSHSPVNELEDELDNESETEWNDEFDDESDDERKSALDEADEPYLWIFAPSVTSLKLEHFGASPVPNLESGVYALPSLYNTYIVAINELPVTAATRWARLLGRGQVQQQAIAELRNQHTPEIAPSSSLCSQDIALRHLKTWYEQLLTGNGEKESPKLMNLFSEMFGQPEP